MTTGHDILCRTLETLGCECVFGLPGSQNVALFEALRRSKLRVMTASDELAAVFMAIGLGRASGTVGIVTTIPGPGFTYALSGLAEARLDSVPLLYIVQRAFECPGNQFQLQALDIESMAAPVVKGIFRVNEPAGLASVLESAYRLAQSGEPGPVMVLLGAGALSAEVALRGVQAGRTGSTPVAVSPEGLREIVEILARARKPLLLVGQGVMSGASRLVLLAERLCCPVITTTSARGVIPEDHPLAVRSDLCDVDVLNSLLDASDLVLALGIKFSHNGARGFQLRLPEERLVHADASSDVLGANYPARLMLQADVPRLLGMLLETLQGPSDGRAAWTEDEIAGWRSRIAQSCNGTIEPRISGAVPQTAVSFFAGLREVLPRDGVVVTDSGWHQMLARRHFEVLTPGGLLVPTNLQAMGFGLPAAIGAKLANPSRPVVLVVGDGGFLISGMEMVTAVRNRIALPVLVFNDGQYGLIRIQQLQDYGRPVGVDCSGLDLEAFADAVGARYALIQDDIRGPLREALAQSGPMLLEVPVGDSPAMRRLRTKGRARSIARRLVGRRMIGWIKGLRSWTG